MEIIARKKPRLNQGQSKNKDFNLRGIILEKFNFIHYNVRKASKLKNSSYTLNRNNLHPKTSLTMVTSISFITKFEKRVNWEESFLHFQQK